MNRGSHFLKVASILMLIGSGIGMLTVVLAAIALQTLPQAGVIFGISVGRYGLMIIFSVVETVFQLIAGIVGILNWERSEQAGKCILWGCVTLLFAVSSQILEWMWIPKEVTLLKSLLKLVLPAIYLIGAFQNKRLHEEDGTSV